MKKLLFVAPLVLFLFGMAFAVAGAGVDFEDPKLCVDGQWLLINAAHPTAISVVLPTDVHYGSQTAGGCKTPGPNVPLITNVTVRGERDQMLVKLDGAQTTNPVTVSYGHDTQTKKNTGKQMTFTFKLD